MSHSSASSDTASDPLDMRGEEDWEDAEPDVEEIRVVGLFDDHVFPDVKQMIEDCKKRYSFDFVGVQKTLGLDFLSSIKLVNYIRSEVKAGNKNPAVSDASKFADDKYLQPVLDDDAVLFSLDELSDDSEGEQLSDEGKRVKELEEQLQQLASQFNEYRETVSKTLEDRWNEQDASKSGEAGPSGSSKAPEGKWGIDTGYFDSYSYNDIHETMLKDTIRTDAYRDFVYDNKHIFAGKTVLDVGCGTGILSMFCAKAGAAHVIAVDNSEMIEKAVVNCHANGFSTDKITCLRGKIEEVTLPVDKVDIIISEWMGYCLLFEAMFDSVMWARDRYLKPDGLMVPSHCTLHMAPFSDDDFIADSIDFWHDVYGFDMSAMMEKIRDDVRVRSLKTDKLIAPSSQFLQLPLHTITTEELEFVKSFSVEVDKDASALDGWCIWFDTFFLPSRDAVLPADARAETWKGPGNAFTTGPGGKPTHWESGLLLVERTGKEAELKKGQTIAGSVTYKKAGKNTRDLSIEVEWAVEGAADGKRKQAWKLE
ncbi:Ribosomal protein arginine N-methyltransferase rmt3 [Diplodia seriata]|uniref:type I protein arginine methyltransferase n=1 Tax=Diplodia seriata TaxID=420778 RepID=A0ABR3C1I2_9PEZI